MHGTWRVKQPSGCFDAATSKKIFAWKKFRDMLPILAYRGLSWKTRGHACNACVSIVLLYASERWAASLEDDLKWFYHTPSEF